MRVVFTLLYLVVLIFLVLLIGRLVLSWVQTLARDWRPHGLVLVVAEAVFTATDPPLRALRRIVPPLRLGSVSIDLAYTILFFVTLVLMQLLQAVAAGSA